MTDRIKFVIMSKTKREYTTIEFMKVILLRLYKKEEGLKISVRGAFVLWRKVCPRPMCRAELVLFKKIELCFKVYNFTEPIHFNKLSTTVFVPLERILVKDNFDNYDQLT